MRLVTAESRAREVLADHKKRGELYRAGVLQAHDPSLFDRIATVPADAPLERIVEAFGADADAFFWTCDECGELTDRWVEIGDDEICPSCLRKAVAMLEVE